MKPDPDQQAIIDALVAGKAVRFWPVGTTIGFMMRAVPNGFQVRTGDRKPLGSFASFDAAWATGCAAAAAELQPA